MRNEDSARIIGPSLALSRRISPREVSVTRSEPAGRRVVELDSRQPLFGRPLHLRWNTRGWRCLNPACSVSTFFEPAAWRFSAE